VLLKLVLLLLLLLTVDFALAVFDEPGLEFAISTFVPASLNGNVRDGILPGAIRDVLIIESK
jgi:hypothetical protein